jgi:tripartite-type tricarboxylate transporter receptor subunit TctC
VKWMFSAPKGLPEPVAQAWTAALESLTQDPEIRSFIEDKMSLKLAFTTGKVLRQEMIDAKVANKSLIGFLK